ncbi:unnamed protein product [Rangifer tarandus platyrhynchus]|uniref:Uncharacterized protein n=1 Tax=Rangifer tarandus platyrhynchus TaxID=3082113 RepID=A0AC59YUM5_RANTA
MARRLPTAARTLRTGRSAVFAGVQRPSFVVPLCLRNVPLILRVRDAQAVYRQQCPADPGMKKSDRSVLQVEIGFERSPGRPAEPRRNAE